VATWPLPVKLETKREHPPRPKGRGFLRSPAVFAGWLRRVPGCTSSSGRTGCLSASATTLCLHDLRAKPIPAPLQCHSVGRETSVPSGHINGGQRTIYFPHEAW